MNKLYSYLIRLTVATIVFFVIGFISLLIMKISFGIPYSFEVAKNTGYILLLITLLCVLYVDTKVKNKLFIKNQP